MTVAQKRILAMLAGRCLPYPSSLKFEPAIPEWRPLDGSEMRTARALVARGWIISILRRSYILTDAGRAALGDKVYNPGW